MTTITTLREGLLACNACPLRQECRSPVPGEGPEHCEVMFIGEAPGKNEDLLGKPFKGEAGGVLNQLLKFISLERASVRVDNVCHCRPKANRTPTKEEAAFCASRWLEPELEQLQPKVVVTLGLPATRYFLPHIKKLDDVMRTPTTVERPWGSFVLFPTLHPASQLHEPKWAREVWWGFMALKRLLNGVRPEDYGPPRYREHDGFFPMPEFPETVALDTETLPDGTPWCVTISGSPGEALLVRCDHGDGMVELRQRLRGKAAIFHNFLYDMRVLERLGITVDRFDDTMIMAHVLGYPALGLKQLGRELLGMPMREFKDVFPEGDIRQGTEEDRLVYPCRDSDSTLRLHILLEGQLRQQGTWSVYETDRDALPMALEMMKNGMLIDKEHFAALDIRFTAKFAAARQHCVELAGHEYNPNSPEQASTVMYKELGVPRPRKRTQKGWTTEAPYLETVKDKHPIVEAHLEFKRLSKLLGTYVKPIPAAVHPDGRVRTQIKPTGPEAGRWSTGDPLNLQNQPVRDEEGREVRNGFIARPGYVLLECDLGQIELRTGAHISRDPNLLQAFLEGKDIHKSTASMIYEVLEEEVTDDQRRLAKVGNFGPFYGEGADGLAANTGKSVSWAEWFLSRFFGQYPGIKVYSKRAVAFARRTGYIVSPSGRRRYIFDLFSGRDAVRAAAERKIVNMPVQCYAAEIIKKAMAATSEHPTEPLLLRRLRAAGIACFVLMQVHDSLLFEVRKDQVREAARIIVDHMEQAWPLLVPVKAEAKSGDRWGSLKDMLV